MKAGDKNISMRLGSREVAKAYLGDTLVYQNTPPEPPHPAEGVYILYTDGTISNYDNLVSGKTVVGVVLISGEVSIVIHPTEGSSKQWSGNTTVEIPGVTTAIDRNTALLDFAGEANTSAVMATAWAGSAFTFATDVVYADGRTGFLPACGQMEAMRLNEANINTAMNLIGGTPLAFSSRYYWVSTQHSRSNAWCMDCDLHAPQYYSKTPQLHCRSVATY